MCMNILKMVISWLFSISLFGSNTSCSKKLILSLLSPLVSFSCLILLQSLSSCLFLAPQFCEYGCLFIFLSVWTFLSVGSGLFTQPLGFILLPDIFPIYFTSASFFSSQWPSPSRPLKSSTTNTLFMIFQICTTLHSISCCLH